MPFFPIAITPNPTADWNNGGRTKKTGRPKRNKVVKPILADFCFFSSLIFFWLSLTFSAVVILFLTSSYYFPP